MNYYRSTDGGFAKDPAGEVVGKRESGTLAVGEGNILCHVSEVYFQESHEGDKGWGCFLPARPGAVAVAGR